ncbi:hypothetical protein Nepgr_016181 [Nepenthes gracilis]|uniref:SBP-type domain-containing protein n=1 Tax=Nepenthes gracilis TaxID=150966 RepID=A0AAD3XSA1_NEPGR|nr:hypothetical protein Nepgr_016181 [Nepenthes gracilis]
MDSQKCDGKRVVSERGIKREAVKIEECASDDVEEEERIGGRGGGETELGAHDEKKSKRANGGGGARRGATAGGASPPCCQAEKCVVDLTDAKRYHRRHKVCEFHAKAPVVIVAGRRQRFCQQCSRFHELEEFDEAKRSCRRRLAGHNERRRKSSLDPHSGGLNHKEGSPRPKESQCGPTDERARINMALPNNSCY